MSAGYHLYPIYIFVIRGLNSGLLLGGLIFSGRKRIYLQDRKFVKDPESGLRNRDSLSYSAKRDGGGPVGATLRKPQYTQKS